MKTLETLLEKVRACRHCEASLPLGPRPVVQAETTAKLLIIGQAPGTRVHASGIPWDDPSGDRLRGWLQMDKDTFYDPASVAIMPMGFCYPGRGNSGDLPPLPDCAPLWHNQIKAHLPDVQLTLLIGNYAQKCYLTDKPKTLTQTVQSTCRWLPEFIALPHPSPRNNLWLAKNPWFEAEILPTLRKHLVQLFD
ncbi:IclR family transcriptional regulator [Veronia nyctiphanis]|uniref:IclR family transcriptional regulator n=1 Tax=Veronia nyctiphanis TaxID=1278244 RepID=A0A4Q0YN61_9GAMM|nr:uracil-DNA glycosylase family protein [Veronia nyctiphanis]RXJ72367.1 IclR family transcriptional regulator [Veronia nyctiphanis]